MHRACLLLILSFALYSVASASTERISGVNFLDDEWSIFPYDSVEAHDSIQLAINQTGLNTLAIVVVWFQWNINSTEIYPINGTSATDDALIAGIAYAHKHNLQVFLRPLVDPDWNNPATSGTWRGEIGDDFTSQEQWDAWFNSYGDFIMHYATLLGQYGAEGDLFAIGGELVKATSRSANKETWETLISQVRTVLPVMELTYSANWGNENVVKFWDVLDFISIDAYYPIAPQYSTPTVQQLKQGWTSYISGSLRKLSQKYGLDIVFSEVGYCAAAGTNVDPAHCDEDTTQAVDLQAQVNAYTALFEVFYSEDWFRGVLMWAWTTEADGGGGIDNSGFSPASKPAVHILKQYFT